MFKNVSFLVKVFIFTIIFIIIILILSSGCEKISISLFTKDMDKSVTTNVTTKTDSSSTSPSSDSANISESIRESMSNVQTKISMISPIAKGNTYYVSLNGNDSNPGTKESPWATPGYASKQLKPGDTLVIMEGEYLLDEYYTEMITFETSGSKDAWIVVKGSDGGKPILKGKGGLLAAIDLSNISYVCIENLEITSESDKPYSGGLREGIEAGGSSETGKGTASNIIIKNLIIHHVEEAGINFAGNINNVFMENVHIHHSSMACISAPSSGSGNGWQNVLISGCILEYAGLFYNGEEIRSPYDRPDGFGIESSSGPVEIVNTISRFNFGDGIDSKSCNTYIHNCIVSNNFGDGVKLWGDKSRVENTLIYGTGFPSPEEVTPWALIVIETEQSDAEINITNVTIFDDEKRANSHYSIVAQLDNNNVPITLKMSNCILSGLSRAYIGGTVNFIAKNNIFYNKADPEGVQLELIGKSTFTKDNITNFGFNNFYANPDFINPKWGYDADFRLRSESPAVDAGIPLDFISTDLEGNPRPIGNGFDIGAYEKIN